MEDNIKTIRNHQSCESSTLEGPIDDLSILYVTDQPKLGLQKYNTKSFVSPENLIPRREECESNPNGGPVDFYCLSPKGSAKALPMGSNLFSYGLLQFVTSELK